MSAVVWFFAIVGGVVIGKLVLDIAKEVIRTVRQGKRVAAVSARYSGIRRISAKMWLRAATREFYRSYDTLQIGMWVVPWNPNTPIRRSYHW
jgi:hypothetical protein